MKDRSNVRSKHSTFGMILSFSSQLSYDLRNRLRGFTFVLEGSFKILISSSSLCSLLCRFVTLADSDDDDDEDNDLLLSSIHTLPAILSFLFHALKSCAAHKLFEAACSCDCCKITGCFLSASLRFCA